MFWHKKNAVAFTNHDRFEVKSYRDVKKPFGKQAVLEVFARSLGFNTYKGLTESGITRFELSKNALLDLNPNPLNLMLTDYWEEIARWLMEGLLETKILTPSRLGNFKQSTLNQYAVFRIHSGVSPFRWSDSNAFLNKNNKYKLGEFYEGLLPVMGIANAIFHKGLEAYIESEGLKAWFDSPELDQQAYLDFSKKYRTQKRQDVVVVKLSDFLVKKEGVDRNYRYILEAVKLAFSLLHDTQLEFTGGVVGGKANFLEVELNFYFSPEQISEYMTARFIQQNHQNYQAACTLLIEKYKNDDALYSCKEPLATLETNYTAQDLQRKILHTGLTGLNYENLGKKAYWVNLSAHSLFSYSSVISMGTGMQEVTTTSVESFVEQIEKFLEEELEPIRFKQIQIPPNSSKTKYKYKYNLIRQGLSAQNFTDSMMVISDYPLRHHVGELFVQTVLLNSIGFDGEYKYIGNPDLLTVDNTWSVKIQQTKSVIKAQEHHFFNPIALLRSLFLYVDDYEGGVLFKEDEETVKFNIGLKFIDVLYRFMRNNEYENLNETNNLILPLCISMNKRTKECSILSCGEYSIGYFESTKDIDFGDETCPMTDEIAEYLMQFDEIKELISKFYLRFYSGDKKEAYKEAIEHDDWYFEIRPVELVNKGLSLDEIANSEPYAH